MACYASCLIGIYVTECRFHETVKAVFIFSQLCHLYRQMTGYANAIIFKNNIKKGGSCGKAGSIER